MMNPVVPCAKVCWQLFIMCNCNSLGHQIMIFVHSRKATVTSGLAMLEMAKERDGANTFAPNVRYFFSHVVSFTLISSCIFESQENTKILLARSLNRGIVNSKSCSLLVSGCTMRECFAVIVLLWRSSSRWGSSTS